MSTLALSLALEAAAALAPKPQVIDPAIEIGYGLAAADVDGDGRTDILLADKHRFVWYRNPDWTRFVMAEQLTERDHVCIAARNQDGRCLVAVGAQWNPGDTVGSGAVFLLVPPADPTARWEPVRLHHEPTTHRMRWVRNRAGRLDLVVLPLHGRGNRNGEGEPVRVLAYHAPADPREPWTTTRVQASMHLTHNLDVIPAPDGAAESLLIAGREGVARLDPDESGWRESWVSRHGADLRGAGEVRLGRASDGRNVIATIEPMHGNQVCLYEPPAAGAGEWTRRVLDDTLVDGHALAFADLAGRDRPALVAGWRSLSKPAGRVGLRAYPLPEGAPAVTVDDNTMACEDLLSADLDGDGDADLVASGRRTRNVVIHWNTRAP